VFDGHGGRAVSQYCATHLAELVLASDAYRRGDLGTALTEAYFRLDVLLDSEEGKAELRQLVADAKPKCAVSGQQANRQEAAAQHSSLSTAC
jgi:serine/threonine protein phosphatase PrpC